MAFNKRDTRLKLDYPWFHFIRRIIKREEKETYTCIVSVECGTCIKREKNEWSVACGEWEWSEVVEQRCDLNGCKVVYPRLCVTSRNYLPRLYPHREKWRPAERERENGSAASNGSAIPKCVSFLRAAVTSSRFTKDSMYQRGRFSTISTTLYFLPQFTLCHQQRRWWVMSNFYIEQLDQWVFHYSFCKVMPNVYCALLTLVFLDDKAIFFFFCFIDKETLQNSI